MFCTGGNVMSMLTRCVPHGVFPLFINWDVTNFSAFTYQVSKFVSVCASVDTSPPSSLSSTSTASIFSFQVHCHQCGQAVSSGDSSCGACRSFALRCSVCEQGLRGLGIFCPGCGHGGHSHHIKAWFRSSPDCPVGCGCRCADFGFASFGEGDSGEMPRHKTPFEVKGEGSNDFPVRNMLDMSEIHGNSSIDNVDDDDDLDQDGDY